MLLIITFAMGGFTLYASDYYRADREAIEEFAKSISAVKTTDDGRGVRTYGEENAEYGFIFYPGGKVEYTAYEPLMLSLASKGAFCVLVKMPFNLAVLDMNAADGIREKYQDISRWYIGGHSLGGSMAASYVANHAQEYEGLILLASYSTKDLSGENLRVLSVCASNDTVLNNDKYKECKKNLPARSIEYTISGGCHAYFGMYGAQEGDGTPKITNKEQIEKTCGYIEQFVKDGAK